MNQIARQPAYDMVLRPRTFTELFDFAEVAARSGMVPKDYIDNPGAIVIAVQMGSELGLSPMQSIINIAVVNGRPSVWGDAMLGLCKQSPLCEDITERFEGDGDDYTAICIAKRIGKAPVERRFSVADAKTAALWHKPIWKGYPSRMLQMRARGFALRDAFPDVLRGLISAEEAQDIENTPFAGTTIDGDPVRAAVEAAKAAEPKRPSPAVYDARPPIGRPPATSRPPATTETTPAEWVKRFHISPLYTLIKGRLDVATSLGDVLKIADLPDVQDALTSAPAPIRTEIQAMLADGYGRHQAPPDGQEPETADTTSEAEPATTAPPAADATPPAATPPLAPDLDINGGKWMAA